MAIITQIKPQKNKSRFNIFIDGKFAFGLDADNLLKSGLAVGQELTDKEIEDLVFKNEFQVLLDKSLRFLSFRPRSEKEVLDYLRKRKTSGRVTTKLIEKLRSIEMINDEKFATWWLEQRSTFRPRGKYGLRAELQSKGVDKKIINKVIDQNIDEFLLAKKALKKKLKVYRRLSPEKAHQKMSAFLARRGFSWEIIREVIESLKK